MKKLLVVLTVVVFLLGLSLAAVAQIPDPAIGDGYHQVYEYDYAAGAWVEIDALKRHCEFFSQGSQIEQYRWESDPAAKVCQGPYFPPEPEDPTTNNLLVKNYAHVFPWIEMHIVSNELVWEIFKPGDYMGKAFMIALQANCPVLVHFGSGGPFKVPKSFDFDPKDKDGKIVLGDLTIPVLPANTADDKQWQYSMLDKGSEGTFPDVIDVMWWWTKGTKADYDDPHLMTNVVPGKDKVVDSPKGPFPEGWVEAPKMNCDFTIIPEDVNHDIQYMIFYEDIDVEPCDSEGKYFDEFVITIVPDP